MVLYVNIKFLVVLVGIINYLFCIFSDLQGGNNKNNSNNNRDGNKCISNKYIIENIHKSNLEYLY